MEERKPNYVKRTQKDYSLSFKYQVVQEIENGELTVTGAVRKYGVQATSTVRTWLRKYGNFDWENKNPIKMSKTPEQKMLELEAKVKLLEKQKKRLEEEVKNADLKAAFFDMMIDYAETEYKIPIRKNPSAKSSTSSKKKKN